jgi:hypothetical protein
MSLKDKILTELKKVNYLSDRELTDRIFGEYYPQQSVNQMCRQLASKGVIKRTLPPIKNYIADEERVSNPAIITKTVNKPLGQDVNLTEDEIKAILNDCLIDDGWSTKVAWDKTHGIDIEAFKGKERWVIEVKGSGSLNAMRVNYFLAILGETLQRMDDEKVRYSIALSDIKQFRNLWQRLPKVAKERTGINAIFVGSNKSVEIVD